MLPLLAPVLAQIITLGVYDRTEARYLNSEDTRFEGSTTPSVSLNLDWHRYQLTLNYGPSIELTPLEETPRDLLVYHQASIDTSYRFKLTTVSLGSSISFGDVNFVTQPLQTATPLEPDQTGNETPDGGGGAQPQPNQPNQPGQPNQPNPAEPGSGEVLQTKPQYRVVRYGAWSTTANVNHHLSRQLQLNAFASYTMAGALNEAERDEYPIARGTVLGASISHAWSLSARDGFVSSLSVQQAISNTSGNRALSGVAREQWGHSFNEHLSSYLGAGLSVTRFSQDNGLVAISVFPDFGAGLSYQRLLARGSFSMSLGAFSGPVLDPLRATVDPRLGASGSIGWSRDRFATALSGGSSFSTAPEEIDDGAFDSYQASYVVQYRVGKYVTLDAGARLAQRQYQGEESIPFSYAGFLGVTFGYAIPLVGNRRP